MNQQELFQMLRVTAQALERIERIESNVLDIRARLPRRDFPARTRRLFREVSLMKFGGRCLINPEIVIVDPAGNDTEHGEYDHFFGHSENGADQGWIISKDANRAMKDHRSHYEPEFRIFQRELQAYLRRTDQPIRFFPRLAALKPVGPQMGLFQA